MPHSYLPGFKQGSSTGLSNTDFKLFLGFWFTFSACEPKKWTSEPLLKTIFKKVQLIVISFCASRNLHSSLEILLHLLNKIYFAFSTSCFIVSFFSLSLFHSFTLIMYSGLLRVTLYFLSYFVNSVEWFTVHNIFSWSYDFQTFHLSEAVPMV